MSWNLSTLRRFEGIWICCATPPGEWDLCNWTNFYKKHLCWSNQSSVRKVAETLLLRCTSWNHFCRAADIYLKQRARSRWKATSDFRILLGALSSESSASAHPEMRCCSIMETVMSHNRLRSDQCLASAVHSANLGCFVWFFGYKMTFSALEVNVEELSSSLRWWEGTTKLSSEGKGCPVCQDSTLTTVAALWVGYFSIEAFRVSGKPQQRRGVNLSRFDISATGSIACNKPSDAPYRLIATPEARPVL